MIETKDIFDNFGLSGVRNCRIYGITDEWGLPRYEILQGNTGGNAPRGYELLRTIYAGEVLGDGMVHTCIKNQREGSIGVKVTIPGQRVGINIMVDFKSS